MELFEICSFLVMTMRGKIVLRLGLLIVAGSAGCGSVSSMDASVKQQSDSGADAAPAGQHDSAADVTVHDGTDARPPAKDAGSDRAVVAPRVEMNAA